MKLSGTVRLALVGLMLCGAASLTAQAPFQFVVSATDSSGKPATSLTPDDLIMTENGVRVPISKVEPYSLPLKVTVTVDNGSDIADMIGHIRTGLKGLLEALPEGVEVT